MARPMGGRLIGTNVTIAIPTLNRGTILVETIARLLALEVRAGAILIVDQTRRHPAEVEGALSAWAADGTIRWLRLQEPSIPHAMNTALREAATELVLFLDDDVEPSPLLVAEHVEAHGDAGFWAVVGQILQPGEEPTHFERPADDLEFRFSHDEAAAVTNVMAGNLSVKRTHALAIGGFDENYVGAAYRFETDFALRLTAAGGAIRYEPGASLRHLKLATGGLRTFGDHKTSPSPAHSFGDYYFALRHSRSFGRYALHRLRTNVLTRFHARHPWTIPAKLVGEVRGMLLARKLYRQGPRLLR
ncbi:MAG: glycosyltransferase [Acidobacteria bacterium]|nr:glycosyltransferase [Acidobacteriota bacterium]